MRLLLALLVLFLTTPAQAKWLRADSKHFTIYSSGSAKELEKFVVNLERFDAVLRLTFKVEAEGNPNRMTIYFLNDQDDVARLMGDKSGMTAGWYSPQLDGSYAVSMRSKADSMWELDGMTVLFHEYAHHFMFRNFTFAYPPWYVEGFAEFVSTAKFEADGSFALGRPAYHRAYGLIETAKLPLSEVLLRDPAKKRTSAEVESFYGRSWLLVHMLSTKPEYKGQLSAYLAALKAGKSDAEAAQIFGDFKTLDKALNTYIGARMTYFTSKTPIQADLTMTLRELDAIDGALIPFELKRRHATVDTKSLGGLRALAASASGRANVWYELALAERQLTNGAQEAERKAGEAAAEVAVDKALAADPDHVLANVLKSDILMERLVESHDDAPAHWKNARAYLVRANARANDEPQALYGWYRSFLMQGKAPPQNAQDALARAFELEPEVVELRVPYAFVLANNGKYDEAIRLVDFLARDPHSGEMGVKLVAQLKAMRDGKPVPDDAEDSKSPEAGSSHR